MGSSLNILSPWMLCPAEWEVWVRGNEQRGRKIINKCQPKLAAAVWEVGPLSSLSVSQITTGPTHSHCFPPGAHKNKNNSVNIIICFLEVPFCPLEQTEIKFHNDSIGRNHETQLVALICFAIYFIFFFFLMCIPEESTYFSQLERGCP